MSYDLEWEKAQTGTMYVRAYYAINSYVETTFQVERVAASFLTSPYSRTIHLNETHTLNWSTTFVPKKVELVSKLNGVVKTITSGLKKTMSHTVQPFDPADSGTYYVRAYYVVTDKSWNDKFVTSSPFQMTSVAGAFTRQPAGGTVYPWTSCQLSWTTNFIPTRTEIGYMKNSSWTPVKVLSSGLQKSMTDVLSYDQAVSSQKWSIRAYYGEQDEYIPSTVFAVNKQAAYACGDGLTAAFAGGTMTVSGAGAMYDYGNLATTLPPWYPIRNEITSVVIEAGVTNIGQYSFAHCTNMTNIVLPVSVTRVGWNAFLNCTSLRYVNYNGFKSQWNAIGMNSSNTDLLNATVSYLHRSGRLGTTNVYYELIGRDGSLWIYGSGGSTVHVTPPWYDVAQYITEIRVDIDTLWEDAFRDCTGVKKVYLSEGLTTVQDGAFNDCTRLTDIYYDSTAADWESIEILGHNAPLFSATLHTAPHVEQLTGDLSWSVNDEGLLRIWLDDDLMGDGEDTAIPDYASYTATPWYANYKDVITSLRIESGVTSIGKNAFRALPHLRTITIADTVTGIGDIAFASCTSLEDFTLPDSIETIGSNAFMNCDYLELIHLPDSITFLGVGAFRDCGNLEKVWLPGQLTTILSNTFMDCPLLDHIDIPAAVTAVNDNAFWNCIELASSTGHVYYGGHSAQWKQITIGTGNTLLLNCPNIHFDPEELRIDEENFPDTEFRSYVLANFDTDSTGYLTDREISNVQVIQCGALEIASLAGIEFFTRLEELDCHNNLLQELDLSANTKLQKLVCSKNALTELSLSALPDLYYLNCAGNQLAELDVSHQMLEVLYCMDNQLTALDLSGQALGLLDCRNNPLTLLNLSGQTQLEIFSCYGTNLAALDLRGCTQLLNAVQYGAKTSAADYVQYQYVDNKVELILRLRVDTGTELIIPGMIAVDAAHFPDEAFRNLIADNFDTNGTGWLTAAEIAAVTGISFEDHDFTTVQGIEYFTELQTICIADADSLNSIDLRANTKLTDIDLCNNGLTEINLDGLTEVKNLYIYHNCLQALDVRMLTALERLECDNNPLTSLILGGLPHLSQLYCYGTNLTSLDISGTPCLITAWLGTKDSSHAEHDRYTADECALEVDKGLSIITGLPAPAFTLPAALTTIEAEAFSGIAAEAVLIPASVTVIQGNPFSDSSVHYIYGLPGTAAESFARLNGYIFVPVRD